jgi:acid phosphatase type 7
MRSSALVPVLAAAISAGCLSENLGVLSTSATGDTSHPASRVSGRLLEDACAGSSALGTRAAYVARPPYLQQVTPTSAMVVWTSTSGGDTGVELYLADGTPIGSFVAEVDGNARPRGARQLFARVTDLEPETAYCYELFEDGEAISPRTGFRTAAGIGTDSPVRFIVFGDSGSGSGDQAAVTKQMDTVDADLALAVGDIAYEHGSRDEFEANYFTMYKELQRRVPIYPASGNHEYETDSASPFREVFMLPENGGKDGNERWYSFDWGPVHFIALDTEQVGDPQAEWLEADLALTQQPVRIAYAHRPPFSSGEHGSDAGVRDYFGPIFEMYGVKLVLTGHDHHYERTTPQNGITYVVTGGGGRSVRTVAGSNFTAFAVGVLHFLYVEVMDGRITLHAIDGTGTEFDSSVIELSQKP